MNGVCVLTPCAPEMLGSFKEKQRRPLAVEVIDLIDSESSSESFKWNWNVFRSVCLQESKGSELSSLNRTPADHTCACMVFRDTLCEC